MRERIFREAWWIRALAAFPGALFAGLWLVVSVILKFDPIATPLTGLFLAPFVLLSLRFFHRLRGRRIVCDENRVSGYHGGKSTIIAWSEVTGFQFDLIAGGRNNTLLYEIRGRAGAIRFHRLPWPGENEYEGRADGVSEIDLFHKASWRSRSRGTRLTRADLAELRALVIERTGKEPTRRPGLLELPVRF